MKVLTALLALAAPLAASLAAPAFAQTDYSKWSPAALEAEVKLKTSAERKVMVRMRDGVGLATDIYRPKNATGKLPTVFIRTPYNMNTLQGSSARQVLEGVERGYAMILQNERGRYFSEGKFEILGYPRTDGYDALTWIAAQPWSNGKVGTLGCSSTAEWQLQLAGANHPAHAAMVPMASGAGIGRVGEFLEQGNWYRGGVPRILFSIWLYGVDNPLRPQLPADAELQPEMRQRLSLYNDLDAKKPEVKWTEQVKRLPFSSLLTSLGEPKGTNEELIARLPNDPAWFKGGLYHDSDPWGVPALWFNSWYDVSIGPNLALFNHAAKSGVDKETRDNQFAVIGPNNHCAFWGLKPDDKSGDRKLGDTTFDTTGQIWAFFDRFLKNEPKKFPATTPKVRYFSMGENKWKSADQWPPRQATETRLYLTSGGRANSLNGDGRLSFTQTDGAADTYVYDPLNPVQTIGGGDCCNGGVVVPGAYDQRQVEARNDVLVYTSEPLAAPLTVAGFVDAFLSVSSDAKDTDFAVKLVDVAPDGTAYILDDTILRARFREGYDREVFMEAGKTYALDFTPMSTANVFETGHRIRIEVTSSNFPKFVRNLNTGGRNEFESEGVKATNQVHHTKAAPSYIVLPVIK